MIPIEKITGRLGNQMFEFAALSSYAKKNNHDIYCQDPKYFENIKSEIIEVFSRGIKYPISCVSIHVRRGDYLEIPHKNFHVNLCDTDYYDKAIALFPESFFLVFSDDIKFCQTYFKGSRFSFSVEPDEIKDFNLMASCSDNIIANSSYSWWAAYLNPNKDKKVVAPKNWYVDGVERTICPSEWQRI